MHSGGARSDSLVIWQFAFAVDVLLPDDRSQRSTLKKTAKNINKYKINYLIKINNLYYFF